MRRELHVHVASTHVHLLVGVVLHELNGTLDIMELQQGLVLAAKKNKLTHNTKWLADSVRETIEMQESVGIQQTGGDPFEKSRAPHYACESP